MYFYSLNDYLKKTFGKKVYKLSLSLGTTCPNRDGTLGQGGCIFCSKMGSGDFAETTDMSVNTQIEKAKQRVKSKITTNKYIAYFQSFTSTYVPFNTLEKALTDAVDHPDIVAVSIATRPDCLPENVIKLLEKLNKIKPIWVELGLQTIHPKTALYIRRGYELSVYDSAVKVLKSIGINVVVHMIIGLPGETKQMIYETAQYIGRSGADGIKLQLLHILKDTDIEKDFRAGKFTLPTLPEYAEIVAGCIMKLPKTMVIHRLTGDGNKRELVAPLWSGDKKKVYQYLIDHFNNTEMVQGEIL